MIKTSLFADQEREAKLNKLGDALQVMEQHVDFAALAAEVDLAAPRPSRERGGRPPFPTELMVRVLLIQQLFNLSDEQMEFQLLDRLSFQRFVGLRASSQIPDRTTIWTFKERLIQAGASESVFDAVNCQLARHGYIARGGQMIDASIVEAPRQSLNKEEKAIVSEGAMPADWKPAKRRQKDMDARWTKKHGKSYFGYKVSVNADKRYKLVRKIKVSTASEHDTMHFEDVLDPANTNRDILADKGYVDGEREARLSKQGWRLHIQRKGTKGNPASEAQQRRNHRIAKTRARIEHVFETQALLCTDVQAKPAFILDCFVQRWQMEVTFEEARANLGMETQRQWSDKAIASTTPCLLGLYSMVTLLAEPLFATGQLSVRGAAWYAKPQATFSDTIASVRRWLWSHEYFCTSLYEPDVIKTRVFY